MLTHPVDMTPNLTVYWLVMAGLAVSTAAVGVMALRDWLRRRDPLLALLIVSGATIFAFAIEPTYDIAMATWYPAELPLQLATIAGRPMSAMVPLMYASSVAYVSYLAYRMIVAGASVNRMIVVFGGLSLIEGAGEMALSYFDVMRYYGNHATILGVPLPSLMQNAGMFPIIGVALAMLVPHLRGWRWLAALVAPPVLYIGYVLGCTFPNFLAIHGQASPPLFWVLAIASTALNGGAAWVALHMPVCVDYRLRASVHRSNAPAPTAV